MTTDASATIALLPGGAITGARSQEDPLLAPILYLSYDGLTDPLGRSQVLPYLIRLAGRGHDIVILSCEKPAAHARDGAAVEQLCREAGLRWHPLTYHKQPPVLSTLYDLAMLRRAAVRLHRRHRFGLSHCRSYIPAAVGLHLKRRFGVPLLFDMRGFWPEEKTEGKSWNLANPVFRLVYRDFKRLESQLLERSDAIVSLTHAGKDELLRRAELRGEDERVSVIPCCVDFGHFPPADAALRKAARAELGIAGEASLLAYLGSLGGNYMLGEMLDFFRIYRQRHPGARFLFVTHSDPEAIRSLARKRGIHDAELVIRSASRDEVPAMLAAADTGIAFKQPSFSAQGCSPTKMGEMLAAGLPFIANSGVGDVAEIIAATGGGVAIDEFSDAAYAAALDRLGESPTTGEERRTKALAWFDVELGVERYDQIYRKLLTSARRPSSTGRA
jgi:glycosyltransferase involved in cell wall biosynthesis